MPDSWAYVGWWDATAGRGHVQSYSISGYSASSVEPSSEVLEAAEVYLEGNAVRFRFTSRAAVLEGGAASVPLIWAAGREWVSGGAAGGVQSSMEHTHFSRVPVYVNLATGAAETESHVANALVAHAWLMAIAWGAVVPAAVHCARRLRPTLGARWLAWHMYGNMAAVAVAVGGLLSAVVHRADSKGLWDSGDPFRSAHTGVGTVATLLAVLQLCGGAVRPPAAPGPDGRKPPVRVAWEMGHRAGALGCIALAIAAVVTGIHRLEDYGLLGGWRYQVAFAAWCGALLVAAAAHEVAFHGGAVQCGGEGSGGGVEGVDTKASTASAPVHSNSRELTVLTSPSTLRPPSGIFAMSEVSSDDVAEHGGMLAAVTTPAARVARAGQASAVLLGCAALALGIWLGTAENSTDVASSCTSSPPPVVVTAEGAARPPGDVHVPNATPTAPRSDFLADGWCDDIEPYNSATCGWDGGDCCNVDAPLWRCRDPSSANFGGGAVLGAQYPVPRNPRYDVGEGRLISEEALVSSYNNYYELAFDKANPKRVGEQNIAFFEGPWDVSIGGLVENPLTLDAAELIAMFAVEERVYRHRCVEAWSIVVPWAGFPLAKLLDVVRPTPAARYVVFQTQANSEVSPGMARGPYYPWPYTEAITVDEARNELAFLSVGQFQEKLPPQSGAPIRLTLPWKYGFKSIKSIVSIQFVDGGGAHPATFWNTLNSNEYGFWANVNPEVPHPRWSQARERPLTTTANSWDRIDTLLFNGYEEEVATLYTNVTVSSDRDLWM
ncbi:hypothetical protein CYMTET_20633 [Cymbomonas tetramitiformis]|uniref:Cytochrome b561 domain-containing protein n=1 Tax=Cymbomonas tetramitiformis TaxID=36881 RepID=A0AAE0G3S3_9CHLO|nr:hypothetical protein CYMTET_20633 [Cymbomonas tetramitiformis]